MAGPVSRRLIAVLTFFLLAACKGSEALPGWAGSVDTTQSGTIVVKNPGFGLWDSTTAWRLEEDLRIGSSEGTGPESFSNVRALEVDGLGRIYVLDNQPQGIKVFDGDGRYVRTIGHPGRGPGEFTEAFGMAWDSLGRLWVVDQRTVRYTVFDTMGNRLADYPRPISTFYVWQWQGGIGRDGRVYDVTSIPAEAFRLALVRLDEQYHVRDTVPLPHFEGQSFKLERGSSRTLAHVEFTPSLTWQFDPRGYVWFGVGDRYRIHQQRLDGDTTMVIERAYAPVTVTQAEKDTAVAGLKWFVDQGGTVDRSRFPDVKPAYSDFTVDEQGYLWVQPSRPEGAGGTAFDVFSPEGQYLGQVAYARTLSRPLIRGSAIYGVSPDEDGMPYVVRLRILGRQRARSAGTTSMAPTVPAKVPPAVASAIAPNN